jgi:hypothetical protein
MKTLKENGAIIGYVLCGLVFFGLGWICFSSNGTPQLNILFLFLGSSIGWILGILITPKSESETVRFSEYSKIISSFTTGFLLAKLEKIFEILVKEQSDLSDVFVVRSIVLVVSFVLGLLCTFIWRSYVVPATKNDGVE